MNSSTDRDYWGSLDGASTKEVVELRRLYPNVMLFMDSLNYDSFNCEFAYEENPDNVDEVWYLTDSPILVLHSQLNQWHKTPSKYDVELKDCAENFTRQTCQQLNK